jgi:hypothetical protein
MVGATHWGGENLGAPETFPPLFVSRAGLGFRPPMVRDDPDDDGDDGDDGDPSLPSLGKLFSDFFADG